MTGAWLSEVKSFFKSAASPPSTTLKASR